MYRQYEDPRKLQRELDELIAIRDSLDFDEDDDYYMDICEDIAELKDRISFAWDDEEYEEDYAREAHRLGEISDEEYYGIESSCSVNAASRLKKFYVVVYLVEGIHYRYRCEAYNKRQACKMCCEYMGCDAEDIVDVYTEYDPYDKSQDDNYF